MTIEAVGVVGGAFVAAVAVFFEDATTETGGLVVPVFAAGALATDLFVAVVFFAAVFVAAGFLGVVAFFAAVFLVAGFFAVVFLSDVAAKALLPKRGRRGILRGADLCQRSANPSSGRSA